jgi:acetyl esterase/lipase
MHVTGNYDRSIRLSFRQGRIQLAFLTAGIFVCLPGFVAFAQPNGVVSDRLKPSAENRSSQRPDEPTDGKGIAKSVKYEVSKTGGLVYRTGDDFQLKCDLYVPIRKSLREEDKSTGSSSVSKLPAVIAIHGGAWRSGSKITMMRHANLFARSGFVVMAINYRHAPAYRFPAQIHDCKFAVRWLKANADQWQVDPDRIAAFGYSAGGHLAALLGTTDKPDKLDGDVPAELEPFDSSVACVAAGGAPCEFSWIDEQSDVLRGWLGGNREEIPDIYEKASPLKYADSNDVPFYFFHGQYDLIVPLDSSLRLHNALETANVPSTHEVALLTGHVATFSNMLWAHKSVQFFDQCLKNKIEPESDFPNKP